MRRILGALLTATLVMIIIVGGLGLLVLLAKVTSVPFAIASALFVIIFIAAYIGWKEETEAP